VLAVVFVLIQPRLVPSTQLRLKVERPVLVLFEAVALCQILLLALTCRVFCMFTSMQTCACQVPRRAFAEHS
jgi:hypothetical protein